jgi:protein-tyrosine kinase
VQERRQPARDLVIGDGPPSEIYSAFKRLRNQIIKRLQENGWTTVAITSPSRASGTTLTAINLAISIARDFSYTVLLVELDLVDPSFRQVLGFKQRQGIVDHLLRDVPIAEILSIHGLNSSSTTAKIRGLRKFGATGAPESANNFSIISRRSFATRKTIRIF